MRYDELIAALRFCDGGECDGCCRYTKEEGHSCYTLLRDAADAIEELFGKVEKLPRWIPVTERLPENYTDVLIYYERNAWTDRADYPVRKREIGIGFCGGPDRWHVDHCSGVDGLAWMPLPEPPKEE